MRVLDHELHECGVGRANVCPGGVATDFALEAGRARSVEATKETTSADDDAETVMFVPTRPHGHRILELALRPVRASPRG